ncbi:unnamed protein product [Polarella glacialis]|uniref:G-protein coupled receptors family 1 profile domain-containing protein n=2 Tax=Polarella glacialis TaxID=89957 RepID=A0A813DIB3_POLGL|nr:unnamed protein product [Polarella glacialis]
MPYDTLPPDTALLDRWSRMRTRSEDSALVTIWGIWFFTAGVSGSVNLFIIILIRTKPHLWKKPFNKYVVSLALPDSVFSLFCAVTCGLHFMHGTWYGGTVHCHIQVVYVMFGITASIWMNVVIARQIYRLADCAARQQEYAPPTSRDVMRHVLGVYTFAMVIALLPISPWPGPKANAANGLACMPLEADLPSTILMWTLYLPCVLVVPALLVACYFIGAYRLLLRHQASEDTRAVFFVFARMFFVMLFMWLPSGLLIWVLGGIAPATVGYAGGALSHVQGIASFFLYIRKDDIRSELRSMFCSQGRNATGGKVFPEDQGAQGAEEGLPALQSSYSSFARATSGASVASLQVQAVEEMRSTERTPMLVVSYRDFVALGRVPRSSDRLQRPLGEGDITVFVSHRWWGPLIPAVSRRVKIFGDKAGSYEWNGHVDNDKCYKFQILCRGLRKLAKKHGLDLEKLAIWIDFACIEQDIEEEKLAGVESLLSYASRSQFILIPVFPEPAAVQAFQEAEHPMDLLDYGERGWCRLEAYVFLCLGEITGQAVSCCGYGLLFKCSVSDVFSEELKAPGSSYEQLKPLMSYSASFKREQLPSGGRFTVESDRAVILAIEAQIQNVYGRHAILTATEKHLSLKRHLGPHGTYEASLGQFALDAKQLTCDQMPLLIEQLQRIQSHSKLRKLSLRSNQLRLSGLHQLLKDFVCQPEGSELQELDMQDNLLGDGDPAAAEAGR